MRGVILINTGSPDSTQPADVGRYLTEFLMDERVIDIPAFQRSLLVKGIIVPFRKYKSAKSYAKIWTPNGSPLVVVNQRLTQKVEDASGIACETAMRYGNPSVSSALQRLKERVPTLSEVLVVPLFPHFAMSSYESAALHAEKCIRESDPSLQVDILPPFYSDPSYIESLVSLFRNVDLDRYSWIQFSYHSIPIRHQEKSTRGYSGEVQKQYDYHYQVHETSRLVAEKIGFGDKFGVSYQSPMGRKWLGPITQDVVQMLASNHKRLLVISPAFIIDNLETIKDVEGDIRKAFEESGGEEFKYIPCLNDSQVWVDALSRILSSKKALKTA